MYNQIDHQHPNIHLYITKCKNIKIPPGLPLSFSLGVSKTQVLDYFFIQLFPSKITIK